MEIKPRVALVIILASLACGCSRLLDLLGKPRVETVGVKIVGLSLDGVDLHLDLGIYNPYFFPLRSPQVSYSVDVEGHHSNSWWWSR